MAAVDVVTGCSRYLAETVGTAFPECRERTRVLYNGVNIDRFRPHWQAVGERATRRRSYGLDGLVVLYAGRLVEVKGVHVLLEAFADLASGVPNATLLIAGSHTYSDERRTPYIERLHSLAKPLGSRVRFVGFVPPERMPDYYLLSDILAFPSAWQEPFGMTIVEGMATGLPVVAFNRGGPAEIVDHGRTGWLVPHTEGAAGFVRALRVLAEDETLRERLGRAARVEAERRFAWPMVAEAFLRLCEGVPETSGSKVGRDRPACLAPVTV
jgi:glycosyltransferase involved in cell wall biosynthesis